MRICNRNSLLKSGSKQILMVSRLQSCEVELKVTIFVSVKFSQYLLCSRVWSPLRTNAPSIEQFELSRFLIYSRLWFKGMILSLMFAATKFMQVVLKKWYWFRLCPLGKVKKLNSLSPSLQGLIATKSVAQSFWFLILQVGRKSTSFIEAVSESGNSAKLLPKKLARFS